jgi:general secretion pathway protein E
VACRRPLAPEAFAQLAAELPPGPVAVYEARGCERCGYTGYSGRTGIYELLVVDDALRHLIQTGATEQRLRETARANGMTSLWDAGVRKVLAGDTSLDEVLRVARSGS